MMLSFMIRKCLSKLYERLRCDPLRVSKFRVTLESTGAVQVHVDEFLNTPEGRATLRAAQKAWAEARRHEDLA